MTKRAGKTKFVRMMLALEVFLVGVIAAELFDKSRPARTGPVLSSRLPATEPSSSSGDRLQSQVGDLEFKGTRLDEVLRIVSNATGENLAANWPELKDNLGVLPTHGVSLRTRKATLGSALDEICRALPSTADYHASYGEGAGGIIVLGTGTPTSNGTIPTLSSVFDVRRLLGRSVKVPPLPHVPPYEFPRDVEAREDLRDLEITLATLQPESRAIAFGTRLIVSGPRQASLMSKLALDAIRHPIPLSRETDTGGPSSDPFRIIMPKELADPLLAHWQAQFDNHVSFRQSSPTCDAPDEPVIVSVSGASFHDLMVNTTLGLEFTFVCVAPGEEGEFGHARRVRLEDGPRAYDVSSILAESQRWMAEPLTTQFNSNTGKVTTPLMQKQDALTDLIHENCDRYAWSFEPAESSPIAFWRPTRGRK